MCLQSRQAVQDMMQQSQTLRCKEAVTNDSENVESSSDENDGEEMIRESTSRKITLEDMEGSFSEDEEAEEVEKDVDSEADDVAAKAAASEQQGLKRRKAPENLQINPSQYLVVENQQPTARSNEGESKVALAFAGDDDVIAEFAAEKKKVIERERPKDIDLRLPGWGEWCGPGIKPSQRRKKRSAIPYFHSILCLQKFLTFPHQ